jgi:hypothetical protein
MYCLRNATVNQSHHSSHVLWYFCLKECGTSQLVSIIIIIIIIDKDTVSFMQGIYTYIPQTNHVSKEYNVATILSLLFMVSISLAPALLLFF